MKLVSMTDAKRNDYFLVLWEDFINKIIPFGLNPKSRTENFPCDEDDNALIDRISGGNPYPPLEINKRKENGIEVYDLVSGHRRRLALIRCKENGIPIERVPVFVIGSNMNQADMLAHTMADSKNKHWTKSEKAEACTKFVNWGWSEKKIAEKIGESVGTVRTLLVLSSASPELKEAVDKKEVPQSTAIEIIGKSGGNPEVEKTAIDEIKEKKREGKLTPSGKKKKPARSERIRVEPYRDVECQDYERCLGDAAKENTKLDCKKCKEMEVAPREVMSVEKMEEWRSKLLGTVDETGKQQIVFETLDIILGYHVIM